ncbi:60S ribosomal export protein NMD3 [Frankliniella fusca]|uniref:60S ribosomal export protein NMD3 n=1 Tax=Frankliniella fusca TaxID=407009 RepID=A0AAE1LUK8_9NEOP|nr:60S ribosomal export protein NMD3 [Frankliniella fusca]
MDNEEETDHRLWLIRLLLLILKKRLCVKTLAPIRINGYLDVTIPRMNSTVFWLHFRMMPKVYEALERRLAKQNHYGCSVIPVCNQLLVTLSVGDRFDVGKSSASNSVFVVFPKMSSTDHFMMKYCHVSRNFMLGEDFLMSFEQWMELISR